MVRTTLKGIDNYFIGSDEGTIGDRLWFFGGHGLFIGIGLLALL